MARILIGSMPFVSHVSPVLPVARKLVERGHDVRWYTGRLFQAQVEATGARYLPVKHAPDFNERELEASCPRLKGLHGLARFKMAMKDICLAAGPAQANDLGEILEEWPADIIVSEPAFAGAALVSHARGIPWAALGIGPLTLDSRDTAPFGLGLPPAHGLMGRLRNKALYALASKLALADVVEAANEVRAVAGMPFVKSVIQ
ncbi:MAG: glycosyltransferase, partial [Chloroflexota bacterium]|nr:glycosyltransferase [Chloroflexota bacterium]